jgi:hypothetical protein
LNASEPNSSEKKSVVKAIRIKSNINKSLEEDAKRRGVSVNTLVGTILSNYIEFYLPSEKMECVILPIEYFRDNVSLIDDDEELIKLGKKYGSGLRAYVEFLFGDYNFAQWIEFMKFVSNYTGLATISIKENSNDHTISIRHKLGLKWSIYFKHFNETSLKALGINPKITIDPLSVTVKFRIAERALKI